MAVICLDRLGLFLEREWAILVGAKKVDGTFTYYCAGTHFHLIISFFNLLPPFFLDRPFPPP